MEVTYRDAQRTFEPSNAGADTAWSSQHCAERTRSEMPRSLGLGTKLLGGEIYPKLTKKFPPGGMNGFEAKRLTTGASSLGPTANHREDAS
jgi:hypothetical protein